MKRIWETTLAVIGIATLCLGGAVPPARAAVDLVSARGPQAKGNGNVSSSGYVLSANGRFAAFASNAADLVSGVTDANGTSDIFVRDLVAGTTKLVSINSAGTASGNAYSFGPAISADGRYVAFVSYASDLVAGIDTNGTYDVFVRDLTTGTTTLVSVNSAGTASANSSSGVGANGPSISADGRYVAFDSYASDLVGGGIDTNGTEDIYVRDLMTATTVLASVNGAGTASGNNYSYGATISADGSAVAFVSYASDLTTGSDTNGNQDVFVRDLGAGTTALASINSGATDSGDSYSYLPAISGNGRYVAFASNADDLVAGIDTNGASDVFVRDVLTGTTVLASINSGGSASGNGFSPYYALSISADGRYVAFDTYASDLVAGDTNGTVDVFVRDLVASTTTLATINSTATASGDNYSYFPILSADGKSVSFISYASDLVAGVIDINGMYDVFVRDLVAGTTTLASINSAATASGNGQSSYPAILSADGQQVLFFSQASDLDAFGTTGAGDLFVRDRGTSITSVVNVEIAGATGNADATASAISADGRYVAFVSTASDFRLIDRNGVQDVFVRDVLTGTTTLVSVNAAGTDGGNAISDRPSISADGRYVAFHSYASDLVTGGVDTNGTYDVFVRDLVSGTTTLVSRNSGGTASGNGSSFNASISADGRYVAFESYASDLVGGGIDTNGTYDVFVRELSTGTTKLVSINSAGTSSGNQYSPYSVISISADGRYIAFDSYASDLVGGGIDTNGTVDVFVRDMTGGTTVLGSINATATASGNNYSSNPVLSADGSAVAFLSYASDLSAVSDTNGTQDVYLRQLVAGTTKLISANSAGSNAGNGYSFGAAVSADGKHVAFGSYATDLVTDADSNGTADVFARDVTAGTTALVSKNAAGTAAGNAFSLVSAPSISADGQFVAFDSYANDLVGGGIDANGTYDVFVRDMTAGKTALVSLDAGGTASGNSASSSPIMTPSGLFVAFTSGASDLVANDLNNHYDAFRYAAPLCAAAPRGGCTMPTASQKAQLQLKKNIDNTKDKAAWKWLKGDATPIAAFGDPVNATTYALCVYDRTAGVPGLVLDLVAPPGGTCGPKPCWKSSASGFSYGDKSLANDGVFKILLKQGAAGKAKILVLGKGSNLGMPAPVGPGLLAQDTRVTAQLVNSAGSCWGTEFTAPALKNAATGFKDKGD
jgi:hypothetical protein